MRALLAFVAAVSCAACALDDDSDRSTGFFDRSAFEPKSEAAASNETPPRPPDMPRCDDGATMNDPRFVGAPIDTTENTALRLAWGPGIGTANQLPASYYEDVRVEEGSNVIATSPLSAHAMTILLAGPPASHAGRTETFTLLFGDRRGVVGCWHQGADDTYRVTIAVTFSEDAKSTTATFEESIDLGPI